MQRMKQMSAKFVFILMVFICATKSAHSRPDIFTTWQDLYPQARAAELGCQLCHQQQSGGDGWNGYGFDIRTAFFDVFGGSNVGDAIEFVEGQNSDLDPNNLDNLTEIEANLFPGWTDDNSNIIYFKDGTFLVNQASPRVEMLGDADEICFPIIGKQKRISVICF